MTLGCARRGYVNQEPYLRRVAYLESNGSQLIEFPVTPIIYTHENIEIDYQLTELSRRMLMLSQESYVQFRSSSGNVGGSDYAADLDRHTMVLKSDDHGYADYFVNGQFERITMGGWIYSTQTVFNVRAFDYREFVSNLGMIGRIFSFKIGDVLSAIPVLDLSGRPAMYDEVRGQLFYNQGTGEFTWGELDQQTI